MKWICPLVNFVLTADGKWNEEKIEKHFVSGHEFEKAVENESDFDTNCRW